MIKSVMFNEKEIIDILEDVGEVKNTKMDIVMANGKFVGIRITSEEEI